KRLKDDAVPWMLFERARQLDSLVGDGPEVHTVGAHAQAAIFEPRDLDHLVDQPAHLDGLRLQRGQRPFLQLSLTVRRGIAEHRKAYNQHRQRAKQLVRAQVKTNRVRSRESEQTLTFRLPLRE